MREPGFFWQRPGVRSTLLWPAQVLYGAAAGYRMGRPGSPAGVPVVCIGNLTLGGAGKTPTAILVAQLLSAAGRNPVLLSRGYGGGLAGPVRVDAKSHRAREVGDEPLLLARTAPVIVARDRIAGAAAARAAGAGVIVMDDGFQNPSLRKDLSIVVVDDRRGIGNGAVFPAGPLRAPLRTQLRHAHVVLAIGDGGAALPILAEARSRALPTFHGRLAPDPRALELLRGRKVLAFAGIGDPERFFETLARAGIDVRVRRVFADHHRYHRGEAIELIKHCERDGLVPVTTEKDWVRLAWQEDLVALAGIAHPLPVRLVVPGESLLRDYLLTRLR
jgi:tetraacyldisaccharide 4'-kinase